MPEAAHPPGSGHARDSVAAVGTCVGTGCGALGTCRAVIVTAERGSLPLQQACLVSVGKLRCVQAAMA